jgi:nucleotide-binding universal stress UspA family protein
MYSDILLPTDGSDAIESVARHAGALARATDATVHVLSVVDTRNRFESPSSGIAPAAWEAGERERAERAVESAVAALPDDVAVERTVTAGTPAAEILDHATTAGVDLVVMGTHGRTGLDHYLIGSVAERVVRQSPVPVLTVDVDESPT